MRVRLFIVLVFATLAAAGYLFPRVAAFQQGNRKKRAAQVKQRTAVKDYSRFSHRSAKHESLACNACHKAPTSNWQRATGFPDVADFPTHASCIGCHRTEFFKGARPVICSICHTRVSPRDGSRFAFAKPSQPSQFKAIFPHDKHQDVIAAVGLSKSSDSAHAVQDKSGQMYNNCAICHQTLAATPQPAGGFPDNFEPPAGTFKTAPVNHASCFNCHWKTQEPTHN
ncbi:MAG: hypothetical protein JOZ52_01165, partial [Acidobacteria bacterium]|nr:hypothetical protein [Acidobacteriota bacterium]